MDLVHCCLESTLITLLLNHAVKLIHKCFNLAVGQIIMK